MSFDVTSRLFSVTTYSTPLKSLKIVVACLSFGVFYCFIFNLYGCDILINFFFSTATAHTTQLAGQVWNFVFCNFFNLISVQALGHVLTIPNFSTTTFHGHNMIHNILCFSFRCCFSSFTSLHFVFFSCFRRFVCCFNCYFLIDGMIKNIQMIQLQ